MSIHSEANLDAELHAHGDTHGHGSYRSYTIGFILSVILTAVPFWLVMAHPIANAGVTAAFVIVFAALQILVHTVCFLHVNSEAEGGWTLMAYMFTAILLIITIAGSLWIMYHLNSNMMPSVPAQAANSL
ncbi:cytochrome o ubiquinol oxidase subunit IV [Sphingomonas alba]|uniref:Cytochrome bo(3) ubiquinol oxidase subunit 4 n=1 Tax=Sphingomonas alba TaxID=2908208 RepID=A0ABT0RMU6_9SPHN|nr:cytochrome o ubiquinol oxidase subunit IV [Sphingomonas alba]MCL6683974.1 cytochrome o ubiquinol oxidase subunit IV [Sphingomonas alba]